MSNQGKRGPTRIKREMVLKFFKEHEKDVAYSARAVAGGLGKSALHVQVYKHLKNLADDGYLIRRGGPRSARYQVNLAAGNWKRKKAGRKVNGNGTLPISNDDHALEAKLKDVVAGAELLHSLSTELLTEYQKVRSALEKIL